DEASYLDPDAIADTYWHLIEQDRSAWTLELDLRPHVESF
ncbi:MAG: short-chain dehydrogenase, partial [Halobacteriales archaeon]